MSTLAPFVFTARTKGVGGLANRLVTVSARFGPTPRTMAERLEHMLAVADAAGFQPSCPVTATVLARHPEVIRSLARRGMEFPIHGLRHNDHTAQDEPTQTREIAQALRVFERHGVATTGFRAPYLRADAATTAAVLAANLDYQSDDAVAFPTTALGHGAADTDAYRRALQMYGTQDASSTAARPRLVDGLVRIPVCVPDDEMLVDRLHLSDIDCGPVWCGILDATHAQNDLFTMQIHPERFVRSESAVTRVLLRAASLPGGVWRARLDEIAAWWRARSSCRIEVGTHTADEITATLVGDDRAGMRLVGGRATERDERRHRVVTLPAHPFPAVAVDADVAPSVIRFLTEDGYLISDRPDRECAVRLSGEVNVEDEIGLRRRIHSAPHPVLAIDRWPNGMQSALALTGDVDALTVQDFFHRVRENAHGVPAALVDGARS